MVSMCQTQAIKITRCFLNPFRGRWSTLWETDKRQGIRDIHLFPRHHAADQTLHDLLALLRGTRRWRARRWPVVGSRSGANHTRHIRDAMVAPAFEVKQKVLQLVVQRIVVDDHHIIGP